MQRLPSFSIIVSHLHQEMSVLFIETSIRSRAARISALQYNAIRICREPPSWSMSIILTLTPFSKGQLDLKWPGWLQCQQTFCCAEGFIPLPPNPLRVSTGGGFLASRNLLPPWCCLGIREWWLLPPPLVGRDGASKIFPRQASSSSKLTHSSGQRRLPHPRLDARCGTCQSDAERRRSQEACLWRWNTFRGQKPRSWLLRWWCSWRATTPYLVSPLGTLQLGSDHQATVTNGKFGHEKRSNSLQASSSLATIILLQFVDPLSGQQHQSSLKQRSFNFSLTNRTDPHQWRSCWTSW